MQQSRLYRFLIAVLLSSWIGLLGWGQPAIATTIPADRSSQSMVVSAHSLASEAGLAMLKAGGNAVDAAVATAFAISVVEPFSAGIGGGGFLLFYQPATQEIKALDFRERAPLSATPTMYLDAQGKVKPRLSLDGHLAVAVPGTVAGLAEVHQQHGRLPWSTVLTPAIQLAEQGFVIRDRFTRATERRQSALASNPAARALFLPEGKPLPPGTRLLQADLARTLEAIAQDPRNFYTGPIAQAIAQDMEQNGGLITLRDLQTYQPTWREPLCGTFRQVRLCSMPPPSSGGVHLIQMLNLLSPLDLKALGWHHPDSLHWLAESMRIAYADRAEYLGDPDFVNVPIAALTSQVYAERRRREINPRQARPSNQLKALDRAALERILRNGRSSDTSHLTVVDGDRNTVSLTFTVNYGFGSGVVVPGTGILLNDEMDDFAAAPNTPNIFGLRGRRANAIAPGKIPLSSMSPTIVTENGQLRLATGAPGGSTIITTVLQILLNVLTYDMDAGAAVSVPRLHHQWMPDQLWVERWGFGTLTLAELRRRGHTVEERSPWGNANVIVQTSTGTLEGAADPRGEGAVRGL